MPLRRHRLLTRLNIVFGVFFLLLISVGSLLTYQRQWAFTITFAKVLSRFRRIGDDAESILATLENVWRDMILYSSIMTTKANRDPVAGRVSDMARPGDH